MVLTSDNLALIARVLRPSGQLLLREPVGGAASTATPLSTRLMLAGFIDVKVSSTVGFNEVRDDTPRRATRLRTHLISSPSPRSPQHEAISGLVVLRRPLTQSARVRPQVVATKPGYEVGSASQLLSFGKPLATAPAPDVAAVWQISTNDFDDDDLMDDSGEGLLDDTDKALKTTAPEEVDCSTKRRACKDCSCGRAETEAAEDAGVPLAGPVPTSSCGSCYLGDAFRCTSCPYLGMPSFKPGEKISLSSRQLNVDQ
jgi:hypothetical protein